MFWAQNHGSDKKSKIGIRDNLETKDSLPTNSLHSIFAQDTTLRHFEKPSWYSNRVYVRTHIATSCKYHTKDQTF